MRLPRHDRFDYSPIVQRPDYAWPGGKRLAFYIAVNIECFSFGTGLGHNFANQLPQPDQRNWSWREYGNRVGIWRLLELLDELKLPACHLANSLLYDEHMPIFEAIRARHDEIIGHGRTNSERQGTLWSGDEARLIADVTETIERHEGRRPRGWMGPMMSESATTPELLKRAGYEFIMDWPCDDQPIWMRTGEGKLLVVPYPIEINDLPQILLLHQNAADFTSIILDQFEEMLRQSDRQPLVCAISLHSMVMGQPHRVRRLREALERILAHACFDQVWLTRPGEIYDFCSTLPPGIMPGS